MEENGESLHQRSANIRSLTDWCCDVQLCLSVRKSVTHLHRLGHVQLGKLVSEQSWDICIEGRVHKQYPGIGAWRVQVLEHVCSVGELEGVCDAGGKPSSYI